MNKFKLMTNPKFTWVDLLCVYFMIIGVLTNIALAVFLVSFGIFLATTGV